MFRKAQPFCRPAAQMAGKISDIDNLTCELCLNQVFHHGIKGL